MQRDQQGDPQFQLPDLTIGLYHLFTCLLLKKCFVCHYFKFLTETFLCLGQASSQYQGGEYSNYGQDYEDNGEQDGEGDEDTDYMNRKSVIKFEDVEDENEDEEREVGGFNLCGE